MTTLNNYPKIVHKIVHKNCGGDIEYIALNDSSETRVHCKKCNEQWNEPPKLLNV